MKRLIYLSSSVGLLSGKDLHGILRSARQNNRDHGVSGLLMYHDGSFLQLLEGEATDVMTTFFRISCDRRHRGVMNLSDTEVEDRLFPDWSMGFARPESMPTEARATEIRAFSAVRADLERIANRDTRAAAVLRSYFASFRDLGPIARV